MNCLRIDLYEHFSRPRPANAVGYLNCYLLGEPQVMRPAMLILPGGGYFMVSEREAEPIAMRFAAMGFQTFVLDYAVAPARFPVALREAAMAMAYIREHEAAFGIRPARTAAVGFSAGGHLCGCLGTMYDCPEVADIAPPQVIRPDALGLCYSVTISYAPTHDGSFECLCGENSALRERLSLDRLLRPDMPPTFLWHTRTDDCVPCLGTLIVAQRLVELGVDCALRLYRSGHHGLATADTQTNSAQSLQAVSADVPAWPQALARFLAELDICIQPAPAE